MSPHRDGVLITGASTGIGRATALHLVGLGFTVLAGVRTAAAAADLETVSDRILPLRLDVTEPDHIAVLPAAVNAAVGDRLYGLVNNAGIAIAGPLELVSTEGLQRQLDVNVTGVVAVTQAVLPHLRARRGRIVNIGSVSGRVALPLLGPYAASKHALVALNDVLRAELAPFGVAVAMVEPSSAATPIWGKALAASKEFARADADGLTELYASQIARVRRGAAAAAAGGIAPERVAAAVAAALTDRRPRSRYGVGRSVRVTGAARWLPDRVRDRLIRRSLRD